MSPDRIDGIHAPLLGEDTQTNQGHSLQITYGFNDQWTLKNIASYRELEKTTGGNPFDGNTLIDPFGGTGEYFTLLSSYITYRQHQASEELQLIGSFDRLDALFGVFAFKEGGFAYTALFPFGTYVNDAVQALNPAGLVDWGRANNESLALYAHGTFHATDRLDIIAGGRQTWDDREEIDYRPDPDGVKHKVDFDDFNWDVALQFDFTDTLMAYAKRSTGYLSGGTLGGLPFQPEEVTAEEIGLKTELFDRRVRFNVAAFNSDFDNKQLLYFDGLVHLINSGEARIRGVEAELEAVPVQGLTATLSVGHQDIEYEGLRIPVAGGGMTDISDIAHTPGVPDITLALGLSLSSSRRVLARRRIGIDASWRSDYRTFLTPTGDRP